MRNPTELVPPAIDSKMVIYIANLIRLNINEEDAELYSKQFSQIIEYFQILKDIDTIEVKPANESGSMNNIFRDDVIQPSISRVEFLKNSPHQEGNFVKVPRVFEDR